MSGGFSLPILPRLPRRVLILAALGVALLATAALLDHLFPPPLEALHRAPSVVVLDRAGEPLRAFLAPDERWRFPVTLDEVPAELITALVASEDQRFFRHPGVDPLAVARATVSNARAGRVVSGASTIPMQLARLARPARRTAGAKLREALRALQIDRRLSKREMLELYLNRLPYGGNVEGVGAAAFFYFGKAPRQLSVAEMALLVALPRSPVRYDPTRHPEAARAARDRVLEQLAARGAFPAAALREARLQPLPTARRPAPFRAPHFSRWMAERARATGAVSPARSRVATTLDSRVQARAEAAVDSRVRELRGEGIGQAAVVILELVEPRPGVRRTQTECSGERRLAAMVGSADFHEVAHSGQVNGALARRSPGSTLKPFLYAMAYDQGKIVPESYLLDLPTDFAGYVAENYDGTYRGRVTAAEALAASLNAPAVRLLSETGFRDFHALLRRGGLTTLDRPPEHYGLPLILGAGEADLFSLTDLYATLATGGALRPARIVTREGDDERFAHPAPCLFSPEAARLVTRTLMEVTRPDLPEAWDLARGAPAVAWKTGTSFGHRDAWALGFSGRHAIGVWVGNFDGRPVEGISGSRHAGPLLFDLFRALGDDSRPRLVSAVSGAGEPHLEVCAESHQLPGAHCPKRLAVAYLPGVTRLPRCTLHRRVFLDRETGDVLAGPCLGQRPHRAAVLTLEPPELLAWRRARGEAVTPPPALSPACGGPPAAEGPKIVSPDGATPFALRAEAPLEHQRIPLIGRPGSLSRTFFWYQDGVLVASGDPGETRFLTPRAGQHELVLVDDTGRSDRTRYRVEE